MFVSQSLFCGEKLDPIYQPKITKKKRRSIFWPQLASFVLPGFDQYWEGQTKYAVTYTSLAVIGLGFSVDLSDADDELNEIEEDEGKTDEEKQANSFNYHTLGGSLYSAGGAFSLYHSFKTAVRSRKDDFKFIAVEETPQELLLAPFDFSHLTKPTTFIPLILGAAAITYSLLKEQKDRYHKISEGVLFTGGFSYFAGVNEELIFRGWLLPMNRYFFNSYFWSNLTQASLFGLAHLASYNKFPLFQAVAGYYFGYMAKKNGYSLKENIFLHAWWDVMAIGYLLLARKDGKNLRIYKDLVSLQF